MVGIGGVAKKALYIVGAKRTAFGTFGGALKGLTATDLAVHTTTAALKEANVKPEWVDHTICGNVIQSSTDAPYMGRHVGLRCGVPQEKPGVTVNRLCGTGFQSIINACHEIELGEGQIIVASGAENMSQTPFVVRDIRFGTALGGNYRFEDLLWDGLTDRYCMCPMGLTAENVAVKYNLTKQEVDEYAIKTQLNWEKAQKAGFLDAEIAPLEVKTKKGMQTFAVDEHPKPKTTMETLARLPPVFKKGGIVTAGNASGICDGAGSVIVASEEAVKQYGLKPQARIMGWNTVGVDPSIMGVGPIGAIQGLLEKLGKKINDIDYYEINEAFSPQVLACIKELGLDTDKNCNLSGGAIAIGHPLGATGSRVTAHLVHTMLRRSEVKTSIGSACIGGGMGIAIALEKC